MAQLSPIVSSRFCLLFNDLFVVIMRHGLSLSCFVWDKLAALFCWWVYFLVGLTMEAHYPCCFTMQEEEEEERVVCGCIKYSLLIHRHFFPTHPAPLLLVFFLRGFVFRVWTCNGCLRLNRLELKLCVQWFERNYFDSLF